MTDGIEETDLQEPIEEPVSELEPEDDMQKPVYNKIQMQDVVKREKNKAYERARREVMAELQQGQETPQATQSLGGMQQMSMDDVRRMIADEAPRLLEEQVNQLKTRHTIDTVVSKIESAEQKYPGLKEKLANLTYTPNMSKLVEMANEMPNTADILHELVTHSGKMSSLLGLLREEQPKQVMQDLHALGQSIQLNEEAKAKEKSAKEPLGSLKQSVGGGGENTNPSMRDLQAMLRGLG